MGEDLKFKKKFSDEIIKHWTDVEELRIRVNESLGSNLLNTIKQKREVFQNLIFVAGTVISILVSLGYKNIQNPYYFIFGIGIYLILIILIYTFLREILDEEGNKVARVRAIYNKWFNSESDICKKYTNRLCGDEEVNTIQVEYLKELELLEKSKEKGELEDIHQQGVAIDKKILENSSINFVGEIFLFLFLNVFFFIIISFLPHRYLPEIFLKGLFPNKLNWLRWLYLPFISFLIYEVTCRDMTNKFLSWLSEIIIFLNKPVNLKNYFKMQSEVKIIKKKIWLEYFELVSAGKKRFELRLNDFEINEGDTLILEEWDPKTKEYTGRKIEKKVSYVLKFKLDDFGQKKEIEEKGLQVIQFN